MLSAVTAHSNTISAKLYAAILYKLLFGTKRLYGLI